MDRWSIIPRRGRWDAHPRDARARRRLSTKKGPTILIAVIPYSSPSSAPGRFRVKIRSPRPWKAPISTNWPIKTELRGPFVYLRIVIIALARYLWPPFNAPSYKRTYLASLLQLARSFRRNENPTCLSFTPFLAFYANPAERAVRRFSIYFWKCVIPGYYGFHLDRIYDAPIPGRRVT